MRSRSVLRVLGEHLPPFQIGVQAVNCRHNYVARENHFGRDIAAALEVMVRFAVDPRWLIYLPPTMSPCETSKESGFLEHPAEALSFYERAGLNARFADGLVRVDAFSAAVRQYCWPVNGLDGVCIAPFHILASEGKVHSERSHVWHMETLARLAAHDRLFQATRTMLVDFERPETREAAITWWLEMTDAGGEGMVVKPELFLARGGENRLLQPAVKCRGQNYLRIIYGPDYDSEENLVRLRKRGLNAKRSLASREFALGLEALERFVAREPLRRVHECVFGVLALESEPVDPRL
ncbi:MAG: hypothetical protein R3D51_11310 [Hyphomicrobiaceae bacterium]